jgi:hypothetical protein
MAKNSGGFMAIPARSSFRSIFSPKVPRLATRPATSMNESGIHPGAALSPSCEAITSEDVAEATPMRAARRRSRRVRARAPKVIVAKMKHAAKVKARAMRSPLVPISTGPPGGSTGTSPGALSGRSFVRYRAVSKPAGVRTTIWASDASGASEVYVMTNWLAISAATCW